MNMNQVTSGNISEIGHDPMLNILRVKFKNGGTYDYHGICAQQHTAMLNAESIGKHLHAHIKPAAQKVIKL